MKPWIAVLVILLCFSLGLNAIARSQDGPGTSANYNRGKTLYANSCQFCHGAKGDGNGPAGASMNPAPADFADPKFWKETNNEKIAETILNGRGMMPAFKYSPEDLKALIDYLSRFNEESQRTTTR